MNFADNWRSCWRILLRGGMSSLQKTLPVLMLTKITIQINITSVDADQDHNPDRGIFNSIFIIAGTGSCRNYASISTNIDCNA